MRDASAIAPTVPLATNAPQHWPIIRAPRKFVGRKDPTYRRKFAAGIRSSLEAAGLLVVEAPSRKLTANGVLEISMVVQDGNREVPVFLYPVADKDSSAHWNGVRKLMASMQAPPPVYFAAGPFPAAAATDPCVPMDLDVFAVAKERPGTYAMWWATPRDRDFLASPVLGHIKTTYRALDGLEEYAYAHLLRCLGGPEGMKRAPLPDDAKPVIIPVIGPDGSRAVINVSRGKGIRFQFDRETPHKIRDRFWMAWAKASVKHAETWREDGALKTSFHNDRPLRWFEDVVGEIQRAPPTSDVRERLVGGFRC